MSVFFFFFFCHVRGSCGCSLVEFRGNCKEMSLVSLREKRDEKQLNEEEKLRVSSFQ